MKEAIHPSIQSFFADSLNDADYSCYKILMLNPGLYVMMGNDVNLASCFHENAEIIYLYITIKPCNFASG